MFRMVSVGLVGALLALIAFAPRAQADTVAFAFPGYVDGIFDRHSEDGLPPFSLIGDLNNVFLGQAIFISLASGTSGSGDPLNNMHYHGASLSTDVPVPLSTDLATISVFRDSGDYLGQYGIEVSGLFVGDQLNLLEPQGITVPHDIQFGLTLSTSDLSRFEDATLPTQLDVSHFEVSTFTMFGRPDYFPQGAEIYWAITTHVVPEPGSAALLAGLAVVGLAMAWKRRRTRTGTPSDEA